MSGERITLDTNILIYAANADAGDRHLLAIKVLERAVECDCVLTLQSLGEFFSAITRKNLLSASLAAEHVKQFLEIFQIITPKQNTLSLAIGAVIQHKLSFWDSLLWATAQESGVTILLSEDFQHGQVIKQVKIINPFVPNQFWCVV